MEALDGIVTDSMRQAVQTTSSVFFYIGGAALCAFIVAISVHSYLYGVAPQPRQNDEEDEEMDATGLVEARAHPQGSQPIGTSHTTQPGPRLNDVHEPRLRPPSFEFLEKRGIASIDGRPRSNSESRERTGAPPLRGRAPTS
mmetsp:Transcript_11142/g.29000  ORF Transcript_11142/g.29000 Transcript_11142/m.29000 type:complete len:142 (-) Transcript_11142:216-641(-)